MHEIPGHGPDKIGQGGMQGDQMVGVGSGYLLGFMSRMMLGSTWAVMNVATERSWLTAQLFCHASATSTLAS